MNGFALWYAFNCPLVNYTGIKAAKQGITAHPAVRLGVYQNSMSRDNHTACFDLVYFGPTRAISSLEKAVKQEFNWHIERDGRGHSEWISGIDVTDLESKIDDIIDGYKFKIVKVSKKYLPLTVDNLQVFLQDHNMIPPGL